MPVIRVTNIKTAQSVKLGDAYVIDVYPPPEQENQEITPQMLSLADRLDELVRDNLDKPVKEPPGQTKR